MKLNKNSLTAIVLVSILLSAFSVAADPPPPPPLPSSFYGEISLAGVSAGDLIEAFVDSQAVCCAYDAIESIGGELVYALIVPAYPDGTHPTSVTFKIDNKSVASAPWVSGTNVKLDIADQVTHNINLVAGWNLVSFNVKPASTDIRDVLTSIQGKYSLVYAWNASVSTGNWMIYNPLRPFELNTLVTLNEKIGFWINMNESATLAVTGVYPSGGTQIPLKIASGGWNLVGFPSTVEVDLPGALESHNVHRNDYDLVYFWDVNEPGTNKWKIFNPARPPELWGFSKLKPGLGYWINIVADEDLIWEVN